MTAIFAYFLMSPETYALSGLTVHRTGSVCCLGPKLHVTCLSQHVAADMQQSPRVSLIRGQYFRFSEVFHNLQKKVFLNFSLSKIEL